MVEKIISGVYHIMFMVEVTATAKWVPSQIQSRDGTHTVVHFFFLLLVQGFRHKKIVTLPALLYGFQGNGLYICLSSRTTSSANPFYSVEHFRDFWDIPTSAE